MKERDFIEQNNDRWQAFEAEIKKSQADPRLTTRSYIEMMDDLSYSRTHYPNRLVRSYLNGVAQILSVIIYRSQNKFGKNMRKFWITDLPLVMYHSRKHLLLASILFAGSMAVGVFSCIQNPEFAKQILGERYITMTLENIENGDPMAVYKDEDASGMFLSITTNNIMVSVRTYVLSFFFGIGTILILLYNGVMVGVFQYFFVEKGLFWESFLTIWQHGAIEISSIVLAGAAGFVLGEGILFPGSYSRLDGLRIAGRKSVMIAVGLIPLFIVAGLLESFVTRLTDLHWALRLTNIILCFSFIIYYFIIYPFKVAKSQKLEQELKMNSLPLNIETYQKTKVYSFSNVFAQSVFAMLRFLKTNLIGLFILGAIAGYSVVKYQLRLQETGEDYFYHYGIADLLFYNLNIVKFSLVAALLSTVALLSTTSMSSVSQADKSINKVLLHHVPWALFTGIVSAFIISSGYSFILFFLFFPLMIIVAGFALDEKTSQLNVLVPAYEILKVGIWRFLGTGVVMFFTLFAMLVIHEQLVAELVQQTISFFIPIDADYMSSLLLFARTFELFVFVGIVLLAWSISIAYNFYSIKEAYFSAHLKTRVNLLFETKETISKANFSKSSYYKK